VVASTVALAVLLLAPAAPAVALGTAPLSTGAAIATGDAVVPATGTVHGTITVTGAPKGFSPTYVGVGACVAGGPPKQLCAAPQYYLGSPYTLVLAAGRWRIAGFYELGAFAGPFLGTPRTINVPAGADLRVDVTVPYKAPGTMRGTVKVTGVPKGVTIEGYVALLCPSFAPFKGGNPPIACVEALAPAEPAGGPYRVSTLPPGGWTVYPGYVSTFGLTLAPKAGVKATVVSNHATTVNVTTAYVRPSNGILTGTVTVSGAPLGFTAPLGVLVCTVHVGVQECEGLEFQGTSYSLEVPAGTVTVQPLYFIPPFYNAVLGMQKKVVITGGKTRTLDLTVHYAKVGTASGSITVTGIPKGTAIEQYTVLACPAKTPWTGGLPALGCVSEFSGYGGSGIESVARQRLAADRPEAATAMDGTGGATHGVTRIAAQAPFDRYKLPTLTVGSWILYPGYATVFGSFTSPTGTKLIVKAGATTTRSLSVAYKTPADGALEGKVALIGSPAGGSEAGVLACSAPPTTNSCPNEQLTLTASDGSYQLALAPRRWWAEGVVLTVGPGGETVQSGPVRKVTVKAGIITTVNFTVDAS